MNDNDREDWVSNDEGLYDLWKASGLRMRRWVRENRKLIDEVAENVTTSNKRQHYLKYGV